MKTRPILFKVAATLLLLASLNFHHSTVFAQGTAFAYQGRAMAGGVSFTGAGQFKFALVTSTNTASQATATANLGGVSPNYFVSSCTLNDGGNGYASAPAVTIAGGGGSGATASATINNGAVTGVIVLTPGSGYSSAPTVTVAPPPPTISYTTYWSNDGTSVAGSPPAAAATVGVSNGLFNVVLGDSTLSNMATIDASVLMQMNLQLRIWFDDGVHGFAALDPVQNLTPTPYAITAGALSGTVADASLSSNVALLNGNQTFTGLNTFNNAVGINGALSVASVTPNGGNLMLGGDAQIGTASSDYHHLTLGGGNSYGYLYGSYQNLGDGIHLGYNFYEDAGGNYVQPARDGGTSRLTVGYGFVGLATSAPEHHGFAAAPIDRLIVNTAGYVRITGINPGATANHLFEVYNAYCDGGGWVNGSDRNLKSGFQAVEVTALLSKVAALPITRWYYTNDAAVRHLGPMAQDFYAAFGVGADDKHIATIDEGGVALAAIQGLNLRLAEKDADIKALQTESDAKLDELEKRNKNLKQRVQRLESLVQFQKSN